MVDDSGHDPIEPGPLGLMRGDPVRIHALGEEGEFIAYDERAAVPAVVLVKGRFMLLHLHDLAEVK
jgi:hypothetical protein